ncbi:MAG: metallophosphoesterase [Tissierellia bacterium]|nr:metallophosphoesterase [Tissierellia bacterium]
MKLMSNMRSRVLSLFNYPYIPKELLEESRGPILMHISDTPKGVYSYIFRIASILKPDYIIHTGDMADDIKLECNTSKIASYVSEVKTLIEGLEKNENSKIYYVLGNHDDYETVNRLSKKGTILQDEIITINNCKFRVSHYYEECPSNIDYNLYGHNIKPGHYKKEGTVGLNGVLNINIIDLGSKRVFHLDYPIGTNCLRLIEPRRISL